MIDALYQVIEENRASRLPAVEAVYQEQFPPDPGTCFVLIEKEECQGIDNGYNRDRCRLSKVSVSIWQHIADSIESDTRETVAAMGDDLEALLDENPRLISTSYPDGGLVAPLRFDDRTEGRGPHGGNGYYLVAISYEGEYYG